MYIYWVRERGRDKGETEREREKDQDGSQQSSAKWNRIRSIEMKAAKMSSDFRALKLY